MYGTLNQTKLLLQQLQQLCANQNIISSFEYAEITEDGEQISDEFYIKSELI